MSALRFVREDIRGVKYSPVEPLEAISREVGIPVEQLVKARARPCAAERSILTAHEFIFNSRVTA